jgi:serine/threonine protein kinase
VPRFSPLHPGDPSAVAGYVLRARLGAGGMGRVYLAFTPGGRALAVKVVRADLADDAEFRARFRREIVAAQRVQGIYTAPVVDADPDAPQPWLATAYVPGPSVDQAVAEHGPLPSEAVIRLLGAVAEGIAAIHAAGLVHRDLKPANVLLAADGPRVIDFGIALVHDASTLTHAGARIGTPAFMAPEQVLGRAVSPASDVFALGNLAVYAATGQGAFNGGDPAAIGHRIAYEPPNLAGCPEPPRAVVERCLAKAPEQRPAPADLVSYARQLAPGPTLSWLPDAVQASLAAYDPAAIATWTAVPDVGGNPAASRPGEGDDPSGSAPRPSPRRSISLPAAVLGLVAAAAVGSLVTLLAVRGGASSTGTSHDTQSPAASASTAASTRPASQTTAPATSAPPSGTAPPPGTQLAAYTNVHLNDGDSLRIQNAQGHVSASVESDCDAALYNCAPNIGSNNAQLATLPTGSTGSYAACTHDTNLQPYLSTVNVGDVLCLTGPNWVGLFVVTAVDYSNSTYAYDYTLTVTIWQGSGNTAVPLAPGR